MPILALLFALFAPVVLAVEEPQYRVVEPLADDVEVREYVSFVVARVSVQADFEEAGTRAFRPLFNYIDGNNDAGTEIAMTAPVLQGPHAAVDTAAERWDVAFVMPEGATSAGLPAPEDGKVSLTPTNLGTVAVMRYSGRWNEARFAAHEQQLRQALAVTDYAICGPALWARYDPPFMPWFLRRNEVMLPVARGECP
ncbi:MAG TPA: heme-binding protein [Pseudomonadales bacterium]